MERGISSEDDPSSSKPNIFNLLGSIIARGIDIYRDAYLTGEMRKKHGLGGGGRSSGKMMDLQDIVPA